MQSYRKSDNQVYKYKRRCNIQNADVIANKNLNKDDNDKLQYVVKDLS